VPLDRSLGELDRWYARVNGGELPLFRTLEDAIGGNSDHFIPKGFTYISVVDVIEQDGQKFLLNGDSWYVRRDEVTPITFDKQFNGFEMLGTPTHPVGWVVLYEGFHPSRTPGGPPNPNAPYYARYTPVDVFDSQTVDNTTWYQIGFSQWIDQTKIGLIFPVTSRPEGIPPNVKWISINLFEQSLAAYDGDRLVFATLVASGLPGWWTRPGLFQITKKYEMQSMSGYTEQDRSDYYYVEDVPWVMYFDQTRAIHGNYWHNNLGYKHSHGCVNVPVVDAHWLYNWAPEGTWVYVYDPSGKTPTDDAHYAGDTGAY
jgi:hypothetical protein